MQCVTCCQQSQNFEQVRSNMNDLHDDVRSVERRMEARDKWEKEQAHELKRAEMQRVSQLIMR